MLHLFEHVLNPMLGMSLTAAFVAVVVILLRLVMKKRAPTQVVCLLWLVVFARLLIPVMVQSPISLVPTALEDIVRTEQTEEPTQPVESLNPGTMDDSPVNSPVVLETTNPGYASTTPAAPVVSQPVIGSGPTTEVTPPVAETPPILEGPSGPESPTEEPPAVEEPAAPVWPAVLSAVWLAGVAVMLVVGVGSYVKLRRRVFDAIRTADGVWEHPSLASPFILGLIRPKIYLPMGIEGQPRQFIIHHERAHLRRLDHVVKPICWLALAIHWFNPLAWVAFLLMSRDIEVACDESVIRRLGNEVKADYSATLLALATDKRFPAPSPLSFGEGDAKVRIKNVLNFKKPALWVTIAAVVVAVIAAVCLLTDPMEPNAPDLSGYTTREEYPGLYFLEEPSATAGVKVTAWKVVDGQPVLVGGYDEHLANNFFEIIGSDGKSKSHFGGPDECLAMFEDLLIAACRELDPDWEPPTGAGTEEPEVSVDDPIDNPADTPTDDPTPISPLGELFLSALEDGTTVFLPELASDPDVSLNQLLELLGNGMKTTQIAAVDLDGDEIDEVLLCLETPSIGYGTLILHYNDADGQVYGYVLWVRAFNQVKTDGTFVYSDSASVSGVARLSFSPEGYVMEKISYSEEDYPDRNIYYYVNKQPATEQEFYAAFAAQQEKPDLVWTEYTPENVRILLETQFSEGNAPAMTVIGSLPEEEVWLYTDTDGSFWLDAYGHFGPVTILNDLKANVNPSTVAELRKSMVNNLSGPDFETIYFTMKDKGGTTPISYSLLWDEDQNVWDSNPYQTTLSSLPREIVTPETYPSDPEWYYKVAETDRYDLYARNHGTEIMLTYGNFSWNFDRTAHTGHMNLPVMRELDDETVAVISQIGTGTGADLNELAVYVIGEFTAEASHYFGMKDYVYDWRPVAEHFNQNNTLIYDADTNSLTLLWNGSAYCTGTLGQDLGQYFDLKDGFNGALVVNSDIICFEHNGGNSFTITAVPCIAEGGQGYFVEAGWWQRADDDNYCYPMSVGITGFTLTWNVEFTGSGFAASAPTVTVTNQEQTLLKAAFPEQNIYLFSVLGNSGEYYYLFEGGQLHKVKGLGSLGDLVSECRILDLDGDGTQEIAVVGDHYAGSSGFGLLNVFDKTADGWKLRRLTSFYSEYCIDYVTRYDGVEMFSEAEFIPGNDPTKVTMKLGGFEFPFTVSNEVAVRDGTYYISEVGRQITWEGDGYYLRLNGAIHRHGGQYGWPSDDCGAAFQFVCRLEYNSDGTFEQVPTGITMSVSAPQKMLAAATRDFYVINASRYRYNLVMFGSPEGTLPDSGLDNVPVESPVELIESYVSVGDLTYVDASLYGGVMAIDTYGVLYAHGVWANPAAPTEPVRLLGNVAMASCGQYDTYILRRDGSLWSYDHNETALPTLKTMEFNGVTWYKLLDNVIAVHAGGYGSGYAILSDHTLWAWNGPQNQFKKIADNVASCSDGRIIDLNGNLLDGNGNVLLTDVKYANYRYAVKRDGTLWALTVPDPDTLWGAGAPLGEPVFITDGVSEIASGEFESILLKTDGTLWKLSADGTMTDITVALR